MTINESLNVLKELKQRRGELETLRNENASRGRRLFGEKEVLTEPVYDIKKLDKMINRVSKEIRVLDTAIKATNAITQVIGYTHDESVLGEIE